jgi:large subunit ribosomal protein L25
MQETILDAFERTITKKFRESGFIPGVLYGDSIVNTQPVKFQTSVLTKVLKEHGSNAKVWINYGNKKKFGFIKEVQKHPTEGNVTHIDVQIVSQNHEVKMQIPLVFKGRDSLEQRKLLLNVMKSEVNAFGKASLMPDSLIIDVAEREFGDTFTSKDFNLDPQIKVADVEDEIYGSIVHMKELITEDPIAVEQTEKAKEDQEEMKNEV